MMNTSSPPAWAVVGARIRRKNRPGRTCTIQKLGGPGALVRDGNTATYVGGKTLAEKWESCEPTALQKLLVYVRDNQQNLPPQLSTLRADWVMDGCEGLR